MNEPKPLAAIFEDYLTSVEDELRASFRRDEESLLPFYGMMQYHLGWLDEHFRPTQSDQGKKLRPTLCLLACEAAGGDPQMALPAAAALELVHNFSLIHDDIEDQSPQRRHQATLWHVWGVPQAINAGDGMLMISHLTLHRLAESGVPADKLLTLIRIFDQKVLTLCEGQYLDLSFENRLDITVGNYLAMIARKTAALIECSTYLGALLATDAERLTEAYRRFGQSLGLAFQIRDDVLGIWGEEKVTGKPAADDIRSRKKTLPVVYALENATGRQKEVLVRIYRQSELTEDDVQQVMSVLADLGAQAFAQEAALRHYSQALDELDSLGPDNKAKERLRALASFLVQRTY
ncbi:MAG: polyprenyl synthetase family protein [Chloroflexi bacterium]|nr:polyprenyl synthetase family protein [Chloroflexota bacterium]